MPQVRETFQRERIVAGLEQPIDLATAIAALRVKPEKAADILYELGYTSFFGVGFANGALAEKLSAQQESLRAEMDEAAKFSPDYMQVPDVPNTGKVHTTGISRGRVRVPAIKKLLGL